MKRSKLLFIILPVLILVSILFCVSNIQYVYAKNNTVYTREELQQIVLSTALQFYYKNTYSDYDSGALNYTDFRWRDLKITPEDVSTANYYTTDCSAFAYILYNSSLGYNAMQEQITNNKLGYQVEKDAWNRKFYTNFKSQTSYESLEAFQKGTNVFGIGWYTYYLEKMAREYWSAQEEHTYYDSNNNSPFVYYYSYPRNASEEDAVEDINAEDLISKLEPGDIIVAARINNETGKETGGHIFIYMGEDFAHRVFGNESNILAFHSSNTSNGANYDRTTVPIHLGTDSYSIQTATDELVKKHFKYHNRSGQDTYAVAVIRPINSYCTQDDNCVVPTMNSNANVRQQLMFLRNEQFVEEYYKYNDYVDNTEKNIDMFISKYNSLNNHDIIRYNLRLTNKDNVEKKSYSSLNITGVVPIGTNFIGCSDNCKYDSSNRTVKWNNISVSYNEKENAKNYYFEVEIDTTNDIITYDGYNIEYNDYNLKLSPLISHINPTMKAVNKNYFNIELDKFKQHVENNEITFVTENNDDYKEDYDNANYKTNLSTLGFIESLYYNTLGIDLGFLSKMTTFSTGYKCNNELSNESDYLIKTALFKYDCNKQVSSLSQKGIRAYATRTNSPVIDDIYYREITDDEAKIQAMLVPGMYGGMALVGDDAQNRARYIKMPHDYEFGDIIITFNGNNSDEIRAYLYLGRVDGKAIVASYDVDYFTNEDGTITSGTKAMLKIYNSETIYDKYWTSSGNNPGKTSTRILKEIYASNLFIVLRPTRLYGTTVKYELNDETNKQNNLYIAYDKYRNLMTPTRSGYNFLGWYSDSNFANQITNDSDLITEDDHIIYARWEKSGTEIENPKTGIFINYMLLIFVIILSVGIIIYIKRKNKIFEL